MLSQLPVETLLEIIQWLPFTTITSLPTLSKSWAAFIDTNESSIYHGISKRYGYTPKDDPDTTVPPEGWKAWFTHKLEIELRWIGRLPGNPYQVEIPEKVGNFYRIKVDEETGYIINTFTNGGLVVSDINDHRILWSLDEEFCDPLAHCEYDEGYIVFDRIGSYVEIWRRRIDTLDIPEEAWPLEPHNKPDSLMIEANLIAQAQYLDTSRGRDPDHLRGQFAPWARLLIPEDPDDELAFKLTRGTLLASGAYKAFLYGVEKAELQQTIELHTFGSEQLRYVDVSNQHIFIVSALHLNVYDRANGSHVLSIPAGRLPWDFYASPKNQWRCAEETSNHGELGFRRAAPPNWAHRVDYFHAAHVSSCGKHLVIMTLSSRIILIQDFWKLLTPSSTKLQHISKQVDFYIKRPSLELEGYLAYDRGKVAVIGAYGVFVLSLDSILDQLGEIDLPPKDVSLQSLPPESPEHKPSWQNLRLRAVQFDDLQALSTDTISCLQLTETKLYLSAICDELVDGWAENMWCYDFASPPSSVTPAWGNVPIWY
ncbi:hypothetical protein BDM02DRAFT_3123197 [Thelephora ganbajun]|uniref:Uncharacterized protein n=1 Tax=Thelephora ganbajun TaxID=370292 RepID=A0ACB6Z215_THEGA|nr:hypothetical protein BDM02DRAFT_3123197 [Thelephora ganbajun]